MPDDKEMGRKDLGREPGPQPDPMLREGRPNPAWVWTIAVMIVALVVVLLIAISPPLTNTADIVNGRPQNAPNATVPASRDNSNAVTTPPVTRPSPNGGQGTTGTGGG